MYILALETTGARASVAIIDQQGKVMEKQGQGVLNHLQYLMPMVKDLVSESGLQLSDMTAIAASKGPGSFTGIRIGVSSARALAQILNIPTIGVPTLKAFAYNMPQHKGLICPVFDARRSQVYAGAYQWQEGEIREVVKGAPYSIDEFLEKVRAADQRLSRSQTISQTESQIISPASAVQAAGSQAGEPQNAQSDSSELPLFFGDGTKVYRDRFQEEELAPESVRLQSAGSVARLARDMALAGQTTEYEELKPDYMRKAEAERKLEQHG